MNKEIVIINNLSIGVRESILSNSNITLSAGERAGLLGPNGSGKSTFLKTIAGIYESQSGSFVVTGSCVYVPQLDLEKKWNSMTIGEYAISQNCKLEKVLEFLQKHFDFVSHVNEHMAKLSGGQQSLVILSCAFLQNPNVLLLDEPTNHIDIYARKALIQIIKHFSGAVICVSHDPWFLNAITNRLWIIHDEALRLFTGTYSDYQEELSRNDASRERKLETARKEKRKLSVARHREEIRKVRSQKEGRKQKLDRSMSRMVIGNKKMKSEIVAGRLKKMLDEKSEEIKGKLAEFSSKKKKKVSGSIVALDGKGSLFRINDAELSVFGRKILEHINLDVVRGERIAIFGKNGSGKSSLVKAILENSGFILDPVPFVNKKNRIEYLDQQYVIVDPEKSVLQNTIDFSSASIERIRQHLSHFLLSEEKDVLKKAHELSGGMLARLAFVMLTIAPIDLLILDEPTNNLDMETTEAIVEILKDYYGGLIVISHDIGFLEKLGIQKALFVGEKVKIIMLDENTSLTDVIEENL